MVSKKLSQISPFTIKMSMVCVVCLFLFCERDFTPLKISFELPDTISLELEKVRVKEVWLNLKLMNIDSNRNYQLYRDSTLIAEGVLKVSDTTFYDYNLLRDHQYTYKAYLVKSDTTKYDSTATTIRTKDYVWQFIGLQDTFALHLKIVEPYLYVCSGVYGLFRTDIYDPENNWEYLGLADTSLGFYINRGVQDVLANSQNQDRLLVTFAPDLGTDPSSFKSVNGGISWMPADSGLVDSIGGYLLHFHLQRFVEYPGSIVASGHGVWHSENFGDLWQYYTIDFGIWVNAFKKHPVYSNILLLGGEGVGFDPWLFYSDDYGQNWSLINLLQVVPVDNAVYSIAFDRQDRNIFYVGMQGAIIKTSDGGQSWISPLVTNPSGYFFRAILADPNNADHLWAVAGTDFIETWDKGATWQTIDTEIPPTTGVFDMVWHQNTETIYIATLDGVYYLKP